MKVKVLGSAAGGAFPQWNCACSNCDRIRHSRFNGKARTQSQIAISADGASWHLLNASPDLRLQIERTPELQPKPAPPLRQTPIESILLTNADLDHVLGLLLMRESQPLRIHASHAVKEILLVDNTFYRMLQQFDGQSRWVSMEANQEFALGSSGIKCTPIPLSSRFPPYLPMERATELGAKYPNQAVFGLVLESPSGKKLGYFPGVGEITPQLLQIFRNCHTLLLDGTFFSNEELVDVQGGKKTAQALGHIPLSGPGGSIELARSLPQVRKALIHINNTNPILDESSAAFREATQAGWEITCDGWSTEL